MDRKETTVYPTAYDYMVDLLVVIQDMKQRTNKLRDESRRNQEYFEFIAASKSIEDLIYLNVDLEDIFSVYDRVNLHLEFVEKRINKLIERMLKKSSTPKLEADG